MKSKIKKQTRTNLAGNPAMHPFKRFLRNNFLDFWNEEDQDLAMPDVNMVEDKDKYRVELAIPGMQKDNFKVEVEGDIITVSCESHNETKEDGKEWFTHHVYDYSSFSRSFAVPAKADTDHLESTYSNGVFTLNIPKKENSRKADSRKIR